MDCKEHTCSAPEAHCLGIWQAYVSNTEKLQPALCCTPRPSPRQVSVPLILQSSRPHIRLHQSDNGEMLEEPQANIQTLQDPGLR